MLKGILHACYHAYQIEQIKVYQKLDKTSKDLLLFYDIGVYEEELGKYKDGDEFTGDKSTQIERDADFGINPDGKLILGQRQTWLPLSKLKSIRYRAIADEYAYNRFDSYISFCFEDSLKIFTGLACDTWPGDLFQMEYGKDSYYNRKIVAMVIFSKSFEWNSLKSGEIKEFFKKEMERFLKENKCAD